MGIENTQILFFNLGQYWDSIFLVKLNMGTVRKIPKKHKYVYFHIIKLNYNNDIIRICLMCIVPMNNIK